MPSRQDKRPRLPITVTFLCFVSVSVSVTHAELTLQFECGVAETYTCLDLAWLIDSELEH